MKNKLSNEEKDLLKSYDSDEWVSTKNIVKEKKLFQAYAKATMRKDNRINIRISNGDLELIKRKAVIEGIPYQTLISSLIHKYVNGTLIKK